MPKNTYWADSYPEKRRSAEQALALIGDGARVFIGTACGEPQHLVKALLPRMQQLKGLEIVCLMSPQSMRPDLRTLVSESSSHNLRVFYSGSAATHGIRGSLRFITPVNLSSIHHLLERGHLSVQVALVQVGPPDDFGWMSLGVSVDITAAAVRSAGLVIAQVNAQMPRTHGRGFIHVNDVDFIVEQEEPLLVVAYPSPDAVAVTIARYVARLVDDGATLQINPGIISAAVLKALDRKIDLGFHSHYISDDVMHLIAAGVITNRGKHLNEGITVASCGVGSQYFYSFLDDNPAVELLPSSYVSAEAIIARHHRMTAINEAGLIDLTGQVAIDSSHRSQMAGITGLANFMRGAAQAVEGRPILMLPSRNAPTGTSNIVVGLHDQPAVLSRGDVYYVVTEYGAVNLFGKSLQERALALISIAHPDDRDQLFLQAREQGLMGADRTLRDNLRSIYPLKLEETRIIHNQRITLRPVKPVDERRLQEHFYTLEQNDVLLRFFYDKRRFIRKELEGMLQIDYTDSLVLVAITGEFGFGKIVAVGAYALEDDLAEVAFSVVKEYQRAGLGRLLLHKLAEAARENNIAGLLAYTFPHNQGMIKLFNTLPYKIHRVVEYDTVKLSIRFDELR